MPETSAQQSPPSVNPPGANAVPHSSRRFLYILLAVVFIVGIVIFGWLPRARTEKQITEQAQKETNALPVVQVMTVHQASSAEELTLPGTVTPASAAHIYSRAAGYLKARYVDLGDKVHKGQLLAVVSAPDLDDSLLQQSENALNKARTQEELQKVTYDRVHTLVLHGVLSQQDDDIALAAFKAASDD